MTITCSLSANSKQEKLLPEQTAVQNYPELQKKSRNEKYTIGFNAFQERSTTKKVVFTITIKRDMNRPYYTELAYRPDLLDCGTRGSTSTPVALPLPVATLLLIIMKILFVCSRQHCFCCLINFYHN